MKILDRFLLKKFLTSFFFTILLFSLIVVVIDLSERVDDFIENKVPLGMILGQFYANFIPQMLLMLAPLFIFISTIFFTSKLAYRSEIIAILSSGISLFRLLAVPYMLGATLLVALQLWANHTIVPQANRNRMAFEQQYLAKKVVSRDNNIHMQIDSNAFVFMQNFAVSDSVGRKFSYERFSQQKLLYKLNAEKAKWNGSTQKWELSDFVARRINGLYEEIAVGKQMDTTLYLHPKDFVRKVKEKEAMTTSELRPFIAEERRRGTPNLEYYEVEQYRRTAVPFATYILTAIAVAIASRKVRGGSGLHLFIGITMSAFYILLLQFSVTFATNSDLSPLISVWLPNILFTIIALWLLWRAPQ